MKAESQRTNPLVMKPKCTNCNNNSTIVAQTIRSDYEDTVYVAWFCADCTEAVLGRRYLDQSYAPAILAVRSENSVVIDGIRLRDNPSVT